MSNQSYPLQRYLNIDDEDILSIFSDGIIKLFNNITVQTGEGSPEGVVTANIGSVYLQDDGTENNTIFVKESGTGNTGWVALGSGGGGGGFAGINIQAGDYTLQASDNNKLLVFTGDNPTLTINDAFSDTFNVNLVYIPAAPTDAVQFLNVIFDGINFNGDTGGLSIDAFDGQFIASTGTEYWSGGFPFFAEVNGTDLGSFISILDSDNITWAIDAFGQISATAIIPTPPSGGPEIVLENSNSAIVTDGNFIVTNAVVLTNGVAQFTLTGAVAVIFPDLVGVATYLTPSGTLGFLRVACIQNPCGFTGVEVDSLNADGTINTLDQSTVNVVLVPHHTHPV